MQNIIIDKPYRFVPPYMGLFWMKVFRHYLPHYLNRTWGIARAEYRGVEHLEQSLAAGHGILLAPNHPRPCDPMVMGLLGAQVNRPFLTMASWHLFMEGRLRAWLIRHLGAFSVYREGMDREALRAATDILVKGFRPLVILPEGVVTRTNDRLRLLQEGTAFIARGAARQRAKETPPGKVVLHPVAIKYFFDGDLWASIGPVLDELETRLSWPRRAGRGLIDRVCQVGEALLSLKEIEFLGKAQPSTHEERLARLINHLLVPLEKEWLGGRHESDVIERVKRLRAAVVPDLATSELAEEERQRRWRQLADMYLAQQLSCYPPDYLRDRPTPERILETVERFEEDLTDVARIHRPLRVVIQVGPALEVNPTRDRGSGDDALMRQLEQHLTQMLQKLSEETTPIRE
jgi:1-acyl-sn-glycerol-3-phosphate acyltransferase